MSNAVQSPPAAQKKCARSMAALLAERYPDPMPHLAARNPWELLVAVMLSAQCTDAVVNKVTPALFARYPDPASTAEASPEDLEPLVRSTGFYHTKARNLSATAGLVAHTFGGRVPDTMKDLLTLPGVARKTAAVVLWGAYGKNEGVAVDTHVGRIAFRLGLTKSKAQNRIEQDLMAVFPRAEWGLVNHRMVSFGRDVCRAQKPLCAACEAAVFCPQEGVAGGPSKKTGKAKAVAGKSSSGRLKKTTDQRKDIKESQAAPCVSGATGGRKA